MKSQPSMATKIENPRSLQHRHIISVALLKFREPLKRHAYEWLSTCVDKCTVSALGTHANTKNYHCPRRRTAFHERAVLTARSIAQDFPNSFLQFQILLRRDIAKVLRRQRVLAFVGQMFQHQRHVIQRI